MTKYLRDGVYRFGDDPFNLLDKYINNHPVNRIIINQHKVEFWFDARYLAGVFNPEDYPGQVDCMSITYFKQDTRVFLSKDLITPDLIDKTIKTELGDAIIVDSYTVGNDYVSFNYFDGIWNSQTITAPFEGLSSWWIVDNNG